VRCSVGCPFSVMALAPACARFATHRQCMVSPHNGAGRPPPARVGTHAPCDDAPPPGILAQSLVGWFLADAWLYDSASSSWLQADGDADKPLPGNNLQLGLPPLRRGRMHAFATPDGGQALLLWGGELPNCDAGGGGGGLVGGHACTLLRRRATRLQRHHGALGVRVQRHARPDVCDRLRRVGVVRGRLALAVDRVPWRATGGGVPKLDAAVPSGAGPSQRWRCVAAAVLADCAVNLLGRGRDGWCRTVIASASRDEQAASGCRLCTVRQCTRHSVGGSG
jgi:hypothetical protein